MPSRETYTVNAQDLQTLLISLNFQLQRISDRLDKIEGVRGTAKIESELDMSSNKIVSTQAPVDGTDVAIKNSLVNQGLEVTDAPLFASLTLDNTSGDTVLLIDTATGISRLEMLDDNNEIIHQFKVGS